MDKSYIDICRKYSTEELNRHLARIRREMEIHGLYIDDFPKPIYDPKWQEFYALLADLDRDDWSLLHTIRYEMGIKSALAVDFHEWH
jgi:hypothetical protein